MRRAIGMSYIEKGRAKTATKIILWLVIIAFVGTIFVQWGAGGADIITESGNMFKLDGKSVNWDELSFNASFYRYLSSKGFFITSQADAMVAGIWEGAASQIGRSLGAGIFQNIDTTGQNFQSFGYAIQMMIGDTVLAKSATKAGMLFTNKDVAQLLSLAYRDEQGRFVGQQRLQRDLANFGIGSDKEAIFIEMMKRHMLARRYAGTFFASVQGAMEDQVEAVYSAQSRNATFSYANFQLTDYIGQLEYTDADLTQYLSDNSGEFVLADMLMLDKTIFKATIQVSDAQVEHYYDDNKDTIFKEAEQRDVRRILISMAADADEAAVAAATTRLQTIYSELSRPGEDFGAVARRHSDDEAARAEDNVIRGLTQTSAGDPAFTGAVFGLTAANQFTTEPVQTQAGLEIVQLVAIHEGRVKSLAEVNFEIRETLLVQAVNNEAPIKADELRRRALTESWETLAQDLYVTVISNVVAISGEQEIFRAGPVLESIGSPANPEAIFTTDVDGVTDVMDSLGNLVFFRVTAKDSGLDARFADLKAAVARKYSNEKAVTMAVEAAKSFAAAAASAVDEETFRAAAGETIVVETSTTNRYQGIFQFGPETMNSIFESDAGTVLGPLDNNGAKFVVFVSSIDEINAVEFAEQKDSIRAQLLSSWAQGQPDMMSYLGVIDNNFSEMIDVQISYLIANNSVKPDVKNLHNVFGAALVQ
jgi:parvulin-like peptidyl-prolyl isomerase